MPRITGVNKFIQESDINPIIIAEKADAVVGSTRQVMDGIATHDDIQVAHDSLRDGQTLLLLENDHALNTQSPLTIVEKDIGVGFFRNFINSINTRIGDIFQTPPFPTTLEEIHLPIGVNTRPSSANPSNVIVDLWDTAQGLPTGGANGFIASSEALPVYQVPISRFDDFTQFTFPSVNLQPSTNYAFTVKIDFQNPTSFVIKYHVKAPVLIQGYLFDSTSGDNFQTDPQVSWTSYKILGTSPGLAVSKRLRIEGLGFGSKIDGIVTFEQGSESSIIRDLRFNSKLTLNANQIHISNCWQSSNAQIDNRGIDNNLRLIQEA